MTEQRSPEWFEARKGKVTASSVGAILGLSPYADRDSVMRSMVRDYYGANREFTGNVATQWGEDNESEAIAALERDQGLFVQSCGLIDHHSLDWLAASPDGLVDSDTVVEVKCPYKKEMFNLSSRPDYMAQIQIQMCCSERDRGLFGVWVPGYIEVSPVEIDVFWLAEVIPILKAFHDEYIEIISDKDRSAPHLEDLIQDMSDDDDWRDAAADYLEHKTKMEGHKKSMDECKALLVELSNNRKSKGGGVMAYPVAGRTITDYKTLLSEHPEIDAENYQKKGKQTWSIRAS